MAVFNSWKRRAIEHITQIPTSDWDWLAIAQHHGLATRLLDWSYNPLVAAYFAVNESINANAEIYCYKCNYTFDLEEAKSPFEVKGMAKYLPSGIVPRISRQGGIFTISGNPTEELRDQMACSDELIILTIKENYRLKLLRELNYYNINSASIFPDLDGLSKYVNWAIANNIYWKKS